MPKRRNVILENRPKYPYIRRLGALPTYHQVLAPLVSHWLPVTSLIHSQTFASVLSLYEFLAAPSLNDKNYLKTFRLHKNVFQFFVFLSTLSSYKTATQYRRTRNVFLNSFGKMRWKNWANPQLSERKFVKALGQIYTFDFRSANVLLINLTNSLTWVVKN